MIHLMVRKSHMDLIVKPLFPSYLHGISSYFCLKGPNIECVICVGLFRRWSPGKSFLIVFFSLHIRSVYGILEFTDIRNFDNLFQIGVHYDGSFYEFVPWTGTVSWEISPWGYWHLSAENGAYMVICLSIVSPLFQSILSFVYCHISFFHENSAMNYLQKNKIMNKIKLSDQYLAYWGLHYTKKSIF